MSPCLTNKHLLGTNQGLEMAKTAGVCKGPTVSKNRGGQCLVSDAGSGEAQGEGGTPCLQGGSGGSGQAPPALCSHSCPGCPSALSYPARSTAQTPALPPLLF